MLTEPTNSPTGVSGAARRLLGTQIRIPRYVFVLIAILVIATDLRVQVVAHSVVDTPIRADAREYFLYAHNLNTHGVYSRTDTFAGGESSAPVPDAKRAPLYPLFISLFLNNPPVARNVATITWMQALLSIVTVLLVFWIANRFVPTPLALVAAAATAFSPHLVTMNIYLLSETLSTFLAVLAILLVARAHARFGVIVAGLAGLALGAATLSHPMLLYFVVPLAAFLLYSWGWRDGWKRIAVMLLAFGLLQGAWITRNIVTLGAPGDNTLMRAALRTGVYVDMMYQNDPQSFGYPYRFDPTFEQTTNDMPSVLAEVVRSFRDAPTEQLRWYLVGKPLVLWSWSNVEGPGDVLVYPVRTWPYNYLPHFKATHALMQGTHWILVALMGLGIILAWLPVRWSRLSVEAAFVARVISILILYHAALMMATFPLPRYAIPMRPFLHLMSMLPLAVASAWLAKKRLSRPATG